MPVINKRGQYVGTISEGDLLRTLALSLEHPEIDLDQFTVRDIDFKTKAEPAGSTNPSRPYWNWLPTRTLCPW